MFQRGGKEKGPTDAGPWTHSVLDGKAGEKRTSCQISGPADERGNQGGDGPW